MSESVRWRVPPALPAAKLAGALVFAVIALWPGAERERLLLAGAAAVALGVWGLRDLLAPVRVAAGADGVTVVTGFAGHRTIPWEEIEEVGVGEQRSLGRRTAVLEVDTGASLHLFSRYDLGAPCAEVAATLRRIRRDVQEISG